MSISIKETSVNNIFTRKKNIVSNGLLEKTSDRNMDILSLVLNENKYVVKYRSRFYDSLTNRKIQFCF